MENSTEVRSAVIEGAASHVDDFGQRLIEQLTDQLRNEIGRSRFGADGRLLAWQDGLVRGLDPSLVVGPKAPDDRRRLAQPECGAAIAINSFLGWQTLPQVLPLNGHRGYRELHFATRCPTGVRGTPPHLEVVIANSGRIVGVAARGFDYLAGRTHALAAAYKTLTLPPGMNAWHELRRALLARLETYRFVDAAMLVKLAIGLSRTFPNHRLTLLYLFLEPQDGRTLEPVTAHRKELAELTWRLRGSSVELVGSSFHELWKQWQDLDDPPEMRPIVAALQARYALGIALPV